MFHGDLPGTEGELAKTNHYICGCFDSQNVSLGAKWRRGWKISLFLTKISYSSEGMIKIRMKNSDY